ncbi:hypothetical protein BC830DRAFT_1078515 [Chytriomyces sp. MP71]|nr:hypothetical protein BC830DRAFT_1078515 [Chytriomyces sp. MP71]
MTMIRTTTIAHHTTSVFRLSGYVSQQRAWSSPVQLWRIYVADIGASAIATARAPEGEAGPMQLSRRTSWGGTFCSGSEAFRGTKRRREVEDPIEEIDDWKVYVYEEEMQKDVVKDVALSEGKDPAHKISR